MLYSNYIDNDGHEVILEANSIEEIQTLLPEDFCGRLKVVDVPGFVRGYVGDGGYKVC